MKPFNLPLLLFILARQDSINVSDEQTPFSRAAIASLTPSNVRSSFLDAIAMPMAIFFRHIIIFLTQI
jgi:hypothetical protein